MADPAVSHLVDRPDSVGYELSFFNATNDIHTPAGRCSPRPSGLESTVDREAAELLIRHEAADRYELPPDGTESGLPAAAPPAHGDPSTLLDHYVQRLSALDLEVIAVDRSDPATAGQLGPGRRRKPGLPPLPEPATAAGQPLPPSAVTSLVVDVLSPARWEHRNQDDDHRSCPSPGATRLVDVEIAVPGSIPSRGSGLGPRRVAADPRPFAVELLTVFVQAMFVQAMPHLPTGTPRHPGPAVHTEPGTAAGLYTMDSRRPRVAGP